MLLPLLVRPVRLPYHDSPSHRWHPFRRRVQVDPYHQARPGDPWVLVWAIQSLWSVLVGPVVPVFQSFRIFLSLPVLPCHRNHHRFL